MSHSVPPAVYARTAAGRSAIREAPTAAVLALLSLAFPLCVEGQLVFLPGISAVERIAWGIAVPVSLLLAWAFLADVVGIFREPASLLVVATLLALAGWTWFVGYPLAVRDLLVLLLPALAGMKMNRALKRRWPTQSRFARRGVALTTFWVLASTAIWVTDVAMRAVVPRLHAQPAGRWLPAGASGDGAGSPARPPSPASNRAAVLALSGGGYRAALFHAGVLDGLDGLGVRPTALSAVSGGSIIGAYYAAGGSPRAFVSAVASGEFRLAHVLVYPHNVFRLIADLRLFASRVVLLPGFGSFSRTHVEANLLDDVFLHGVRHHELDGPAGRRIPLMPCLTDLRGGRAIGVLPQGVVVQMIAPALTRFHFANADTAAPEPEFRPSRRGAGSQGQASQQRTSLLVAGSGAFPGAFKPLPLLLPPGASGASPEDTVLVADGGIVDNSGVVLAYAANRRARSATDAESERAMRPWRTDLVIASDGSALDAGAGVPRTLPAELSRALDVLYRSTSGEALTLPHPHPRTVSLSVTVLAQLLKRAPGRTKAQQGMDAARWESLLDRLGPGDLRALLSLDPDGTTAPEELRALERWAGSTAVDSAGPPPAELRRAVRKRALAALGVFIQTPTLKDQLTAPRAAALYRLGRYSVILFSRELLDPNASPAPLT